MDKCWRGNFTRRFSTAKFLFLLQIMFFAVVSIITTMSQCFYGVLGNEGKRYCYDLRVNDVGILSIVGGNFR